MGWVCSQSSRNQSPLECGDCHTLKRYSIWPLGIPRQYRAPPPHGVIQPGGKHHMSMASHADWQPEFRLQVGNIHLGPMDRQVQMSPMQTIAVLGVFLCTP